MLLSLCRISEKSNMDSSVKGNKYNEHSELILFCFYMYTYNQEVE